MTWFVIEPHHRGGLVGYTLHIKPWHPGFWLYAYRHIRQGGCGVMEALRLTIALILEVRKYHN